VQTAVVTTAAAIPADEWSVSWDYDVATPKKTDLVEWLPDAVVVIDADGIVVRANRAAERALQRPRSEWLGMSGLDLVHPDDLHLAALSLASVEGKEVGTPIELRMRNRDGWRLVEVVGAPLEDGFIALSMRDLTERRRWEVAGGETARFRSLVQHAASITMLLSGAGVVESVSAAVTRMLGHDPEDVCDQPLLRIVAPDDRALVAAAIEAAADSPSGSRPITVEALLLRAGDHGVVPFELTIVSLLDDPTVGGLVLSGHDISRLRAAQESLAELAHFDSLTGLPNRRAFDAALEREWALAALDGTDSFVIVADLDHFKALNDLHGHAAGDEALRQVARALRASVRETDFVARLGGDEFAVILIRCAGEPAVLGFEAVLRERLTERLQSLPISVDMTLGHASLRKAASPAAALHDADLAMLSQKRPA
jgi:diguanylate cyclase (GGDEF)-like protein/PAS domain S-box-containing protein